MKEVVVTIFAIMGFIGLAFAEHGNAHPNWIAGNEACQRATFHEFKVTDSPIRFGVAYGSAEIQDNDSRYVTCDNGERVLR